MRASTSLVDLSCSGDMYEGEPMIVAVAVSAGSRLGSSPPRSSFEMPKSSSLTHGEPSARRVTKRFDGLRSRWTMPAACTSASASHAWRAISHASSIGQRAASRR